MVFNEGKILGVLFFPVTGFKATFNCVVDVTEDNSLVVFITYNGTICPQEKRSQLAELMTRLNSKIKYGNFEMNMESGDIKFRTSIYYEEMAINDKIIENIILKNIYTHDFSHPFLSGFLFGNMNMDEVYMALFPADIIEDSKTKLIEN